MCSNGRTLAGEAQCNCYTKGERWMGKGAILHTVPVVHSNGSDESNQFELPVKFKWNSNSLISPLSPSARSALKVEFIAGQVCLHQGIIHYLWCMMPRAIQVATFNFQYWSVAKKYTFRLYLLTYIPPSHFVLYRSLTGEWEIKEITLFAYEVWSILSLIITRILW